MPGSMAVPAGTLGIDGANFFGSTFIEGIAGVQGKSDFWPSALTNFGATGAGDFACDWNGEGKICRGGNGRNCCASSGIETNRKNSAILIS